MIPRAQLDFQVLHAKLEFIETDAVVEVEVEEAEGRTEVLETLLQTDPHELQQAVKLLFSLRDAHGFSCCFRLRIGGEEAVHLGRALQVLDALFDGIVYVTVNQVAERIQIYFARVIFLICDRPHEYIFCAANLPPDLKIVMCVSNAAILAYRDAVALVKLRRVEQMILERSQVAEVYSVRCPLAHPGYIRITNEFAD